jgi:sugar lactone lactonase YvrE
VSERHGKESASNPAPTRSVGRIFALFAVLLVSLTLTAAASADVSFIKAYGWGVLDGASQFETCTSTCQAGIAGSGAGQLYFAYGVATDPSGDVYVADYGNERIDEFSAAGAFIKAIGTFGSGAGQIAGPLSVTIDSAGDVYVADYGNARIDEFSSSGAFIEAYGWDVVPGGIGGLETCTTTSTCQQGIPGSEAGALLYPAGIATNRSGDVYVADFFNNRIDEFSAAGDLIEAIGTAGSGAGQLKGPTDVATDSSGDVYVADDGNERIDEFSAAGAFIKAYGWGVADGASQFETCTTSCQAGIAGGGVGQLDEPEGIATSHSGDVYVTDAHTDRIDEFSAAGVFIEAIGTAGSGAGQLDYPEGVATDSSGNIYVSDYDNFRIDEFSGSVAAPDIIAAPDKLTRSTSASFEFTSDTEGAQFECSLDGSAFSACISPLAYSGLGDGEHTFQVREHDPGEEPGVAGEYIWSVYTHPPTVVIDSAPSGGGNESTATVTFSGSAEDGNDAAIAFTCSLDGAAPVPCASPDVLTGLADGVHTISISAEDDVGNTSATPASATWLVGGSGSGVSSIPPESTCAGSALASVSSGLLVMDARDGACITSATVAGVGVWQVGGPVTLDGITVTPDPGTKLTLTKSAQGAKFSSTGGVTFQLGGLEPVQDSARITWTLSGGLLNTGANVPFVKSIAGLAANLGLSELKLSSAEGGSVKLTFRPTLPKVFSSLPGSPNAVAGQFTVTASNANGLDFSGQLSVGQLYLGAIELRKLRLGFDASTLTFDGSVTVALVGQGGPSIATSLTIGPESPASVFGCCVRQFAVTAQNLNEPIPATPLFLQSIGGAAQSGKEADGSFYPIISGNAAVSIGPKVRSSPAAVQIAGSLTLELSKHWTLAIAGNATVESFPLASGKATYTSEPAGVQLEGKVQATVEGYGFAAEVTPKTFFQGTQSFNIDAIGSVTLGALGSLQGEIVFSNNGLAACATISPPYLPSYSIGWGELPNGAHAVLAGTCDMGPYSATMASVHARAAGTPLTLALAAHSGPRLVAVHGSSAAPQLTLTGPDGLSLDGASGATQTPTGLIIPDPTSDTAFVVLNRSPAGTYTLTSANTGIVSVATANSLPPVSVTVHTRPLRNGQRQLTYSQRTAPGQKLELYEQGSNGGGRLLASSSRAHGQLTYTPTIGLGATRTILAVTIANGLPRATETLAQYHVNDSPPGRVHSLSRHGQQLSWSKTPRAVRYMLAFTTNNGATPTITTRARTTRIPASATTATIVAIDAANRPGPVATIKLPKLLRHLSRPKQKDKT